MITVIIMLWTEARWELKHPADPEAAPPPVVHHPKGTLADVTKAQGRRSSPRPPENLAAWKSTSPPENSARLKPTSPPENSAQPK